MIMRWPAFLALAAISWLAPAAGPELPVHPKQGVADLLLEYLEVRYPGRDLEGTILYVSIANQRMYHVQDGHLLHDYAVSTAQNGPGAEENSFRTPTGLHRVSEKFGDAVPPLGILVDRRYTGELADPDFAGVDKDWITSRLLWLDGLEPGTNKGGARDSHGRYIYIHGTANERSIGTPSSRGCVRMLNTDVIALYDQVSVGALVVILDN